jgi:hypothetical protein
MPRATKKARPTSTVRTVLRIKGPAQATPLQAQKTRLAELKAQAQAAERARALIDEEVDQAFRLVLDHLDTYLPEFTEAQRKTLRHRLRQVKAAGRGTGSHPPNKRLRDKARTPFYWAGRGTHPIPLQNFENTREGKALLKAGEPLWEPLP